MLISKCSIRFSKFTEFMSEPLSWNLLSEMNLVDLKGFIFYFQRFVNKVY